jgi:hypothetical protein
MILITHSLCNNIILGTTLDIKDIQNQKKKTPLKWPDSQSSSMNKPALQGDAKTMIKVLNIMLLQPVMAIKVNMLGHEVDLFRPIFICLSMQSNNL